MEALTLAQASALFEQLPLPVRPATLHPAYVHADARRDPILQPVYLAHRAQGECWLHSLHLTQVPGTGCQDASSPYGYGGPLCTTDDAGFVHEAWSAYAAWMRAQRVAVEYIRFHPVLRNERHYGGQVEDNREVVCVDLAAGDPWSGYALRLRQSLKKADAAGLAYEEVPLAACVAQFGDYYRAAMREIGADPFYLFGHDYFAGLAASPGAQVAICTGAGASGWLAASLLLRGAGMCEYHLAATTAAGRQRAASSWLLHRAIAASREQGLRSFYLGGGTDRQRDNRLLFFKAAFSPLRLQYRTGSAVFDTDAYQLLAQRFARARAAHPERPIFYRKV